MRFTRHVAVAFCCHSHLAVGKVNDGLPEAVYIYRPVAPSGAELGHHQHLKDQVQKGLQPGWKQIFRHGISIDELLK
ncbi:hypothetical protein pipiens_006042 [Culex pipiens pipiens]|uniref:Uncharacterized protein n=1 Tax=Culex pipiens pipiens TaxID=38569 RepID=A0ABD1DSI6_CULPP